MLWAAMGNDTGDSYKRSLALSNFTLGQTAALSKFANYGQELGSNYWQTFGHILGEAVNQFAGTPADPADGDAIEAYKNKSLQGIRDWNPLLDVTMHSQWHLVFSGDYTGTIEDSRLMREQFPPKPYSLVILESLSSTERMCGTNSLRNCEPRHIP